MVLGLGRHLLLRELSNGGWIAIVAVVVIVLLLFYWSPLVERLERWWRSR
jgi:hypothetical protein